MRQIFLLLTMAVFLISCTPTKVTHKEIQAKTETLDFDDSTSATLTGKAWQSSADKDYPALFAYTQKCVELYGAEGKRMNDELEYFASPDKVNEYSALNDVGTSLFIMANAYVELEMYPQAAEAYNTLASDYKYAQCWDPKGWYWHPATGAASKAKQYKYK